MEYLMYSYFNIYSTIHTRITYLTPVVMDIDPTSLQCICICLTFYGIIAELDTIGWADLQQIRSNGKKCGRDLYQIEI